MRHANHAWMELKHLQNEMIEKYLSKGSTIDRFMCQDKLNEFYEGNSLYKFVFQGNE